MVVFPKTGINKEISVKFANDCAAQAQKSSATVADAAATAPSASAANAFAATARDEAAERKRQAEFIRSIVPNPFK